MLTQSFERPQLTSSTHLAAYRPLALFKSMDDFDLTNLNWVSGAEAPMHASLSPPSGSFARHVPIDNNKKKGPTILVDKFGNKKPTCSYSCLIALALRAATVTETGACLPVQEIYSCIEELFPFFKSVSDGWKNCVRHNLSLNQCFRKMLREEGWEGKKGYFWEIHPDSAEALEKEVNKFLQIDKRSLDDMRATLLCKWAKPTSQQQRTPTRKTVRTAAIPQQPDQLEDILASPSELTIYSPQIQKQLKKCRTPIKPKTEETERVFDTNSTPSDFVGIHTAQSDEIGAARELFTCGSTSETDSPCPIYMSTNHGEIVPLSTSPMYGMYGLPSVGYGYGTPTSSPIMGVSPVSSGSNTSFVSPPYMPLVPVNMFAPYVMNCNGQPWPIISPPCQNCGHQNNPLLPSSVHSDDCKSTSKQKYSCKPGTKRKNLKSPATPKKKIKTPKCTRKLQFEQEAKKCSLQSKQAEKIKPPVKDSMPLDEDSFIDVESDTESLEVCSPPSNISSSITDSVSDGAVVFSSFGGLSEKIKEAEVSVNKRTEMSLHSQNALQASTSCSSSTQTIHQRPFKALPVLECMTLAEGSSTHDNESADEGIPALHSLLNMGDASIVGITNAMRLS